MLTYQLQDRVFQVQDGVHLSFPNTVIVKLRLHPAVPFGGAQGPSRNVVPDVPILMRFNTATGRAFAERDGGPLFDPIEVSLKVADTALEVRGNEVSLESVCSSLGDLHDLISAVFYAFPAVLNVYIPDPPYSTHITGEVAGVPFSWLYEPSQLRAVTVVTSQGHQEALVADSWRHVALLSGDSGRPLMGGLHYFHIACRLLVAGLNRYEFLSEAILNFSRSLLALFGESRDDVRKEIRKLKKYSDDEIEAKFVTALILRNEFDIAHISLSVLEKSQLRTLHDYCKIAEQSIRKLLQLVIETTRSGSYSPVRDPSATLSSDKVKILRDIQKNLDAVVPDP